MKFKKGDEVVVVKTTGPEESSYYGIYKTGWKGVVVKTRSLNESCIIDFHWPRYESDFNVHVDELELASIVKTPLWKALE